MELMNTVGAAQTGGLTGSTFTIYDNRRANKRVFQFERDSGTCTWILEGRIGDGYVWNPVDTGTDTDFATVDAWPQIRMRLSAASSFVGRASIDASGRIVS